MEPAESARRRRGRMGISKKQLKDFKTDSFYVFSGTNQDSGGTYG
jgi:hypothetical protein